MFNRQNTTWRKASKIICGLFIAFALMAAPLAQQTAQATGWPTVDALLNGSAIAQNGTSAAILGKTIANWVLKILSNILMQIAKVLLNKLTESTVNWINGGFEGSPKFVQNPESFFKNIGDTQLSSLIDTVGYNASLFPFGRQVSQVLIGAYKNQNSDIATSMRYTLSDVVGSEATHFEKDFGVGGWSGYHAYTQNPSNNAFSSLFVGAKEAAKTVTAAQTKVDKDITTGGGFLNQRTCKTWRTGPELPAGFIGPPPPPPDHTDANCLTWTTTTPGSSVKDQLDKALGSKFSQSELGAALGNSISSIVNALTTQLLNKGLSALSTAIKGTSSGTPQQTWSYNGETLDSTNTSDPNDPANWSLADQENHLNELFYTGEDIGITDENGNPQKLTLIEQAYLEAEAYRDILGIVNGVEPTNPTIGTLEFCTDNPQDPNCAAVHKPSFAAVIKALDYAIPGPKYGWRNRLTDRLSGGLQKWTQKASSIKDDKRQQKAQDIADALQSANDDLPTDMELQLLTADIPSYNDAIALVQTGVGYNTHVSEYTDNYTKTLVAIARLKAIKSALDGILIAHSVPTCVSQAFCEANPADPTCVSPSYDYCTTHSADADCLAKNYCSSEADLNLDQFVHEHSALDSISPKHLLNYPSAGPNWQSILSQPPLINPFNELDIAGQNLLKKQIKAYTLINQDLPNSGTISSAQNDKEQVAAEYQNIGFMQHKVEGEIHDNADKNIYKVQYGGNNHKFVQDSGATTIVAPVTIAQAVAAGASQSDLETKGYSITATYTPPAQTVGAGILSALGALFGIPPGAVASAIINPIPDVMYIDSLGAGSIAETKTAEISGFDEIAPVTEQVFCQANPNDATCSTEAPLCQTTPNDPSCGQLTWTQIAPALQADPWKSDTLDDAHKTILDSLSVELLNTMYSLVVSTTPVTDLGEDWDPNSTGNTRLADALDTINDADSVSTELDNTDDTPGKIFFCQAVLDKRDNQSKEMKGGSISLFHRHDVRLTCAKFYDSRDSDYTKPQI